MAPRKPKADDDNASTTSTEQVLKPKTEKAKVTKPKAEKAAKSKVDKPKPVKKATDAEKGEKVNKEKKVVDGAKEGAKDTSARETKDWTKDGKEKAKAVTGEEAMEVIKQYLREQNRPYSATDVTANLRGKVTKTVADKLLKEMEQNGQIMGKATKKDGGGQWVFWAVQDPSDTASPEELTTMDTTISTLRELIPTLKATLKTSTTQLTTLRSAPTTAALLSTIDSLRQSNVEKMQRLQAFERGNGESVSKEEKERVEKEWKEWKGKRERRMRAFKGLEEMLLAGMAKEELWERAGLEGEIEGF